MVAFDRPAVESKAHSIVVSIAADRKQLAGIEDQILSLLAQQSLVQAPKSSPQITNGPSGVARPIRRRLPSRVTGAPSSALHAILDDQHLINTLQVLCC